MALRSRHILAALLASLALPASASAGVVSFSGAERPLSQEWASWSCAG